MSTFTIPLSATPAQTLSVYLGAQRCRINVYQRLTGLFVDLYVNDVAVITGVLALNLVKVVREAYRGFAGDIFFLDTQGADDPTYDGLGSRYQLVWDDAA